MNRILLAFAAVGCSKQDAGPPRLALSELGLTIVAPGCSAHSYRPKTVDVESPGMSLKVGAAAPDLTPDDMLPNLKLMGPKDVVTDKLADGWALTFKTGGVDPSWEVVVYRTLDGDHFTCVSTRKTAELVPPIITACKTLAKR